MDTTTPSNETFINRISTRTLWVLHALGAVALVLSGYLAWAAFTSSKVAGCGGGNVFDCGHVLTSRWSTWFGIPVGATAVGLYIVMQIGLVIACRSRSEQVRRFAWSTVTVLGTMAALSALWFVGLQVFVLQHLCWYCLAAHACGLTICAILLWKRPFPEKSMSRLSLLSAAGTAVLVGGQFLNEEPQKFIIEFHADVAEDNPNISSDTNPGEGLFLFEPDIDTATATVAADTEVFEAPGFEEPVFEQPIFEAPGFEQPIFAAPDFERAESKASNADPAQDTVVPVAILEQGGLPVIWLLVLLTLVIPASTANSQTHRATSADQTTKTARPADTDRRTVELGTSAKLDVQQWPLLGSPDAKYVFVEMFDYTCSHCRATNETVKAACKQMGDELAIVALPVPLDAVCNPHSNGGHAGGCEIAKLAVAVWRVDRQKFPDFHNWLFETSSARTPFDARNRAAELIGQQALDKEIAGGIPARYVAKHVELYKRVGAGSVPKLIFPKITLVGEVGSAKYLCETIESQLP